MNSSKRPPQSDDSPPAVDPPQRDPSTVHEAPEQDQRRGLGSRSVTEIAVPACTAVASGWHSLRHSSGLEIPVAQSLVPKIATGTSGIEYAPLLDRGTAYGRELHACQDQGDRRDWRDAFARRPDRQDARGAPGQPEASWPRGPVHRAHGRGKAASRGGARRQRSLELSRAGSRLAEGPPLSRGGEPAQIVIVRNRRMITARITIVRLPSTGLPYELRSTCAPPRTSPASARFRSRAPRHQNKHEGLPRHLRSARRPRRPRVRRDPARDRAASRRARDREGQADRDLWRDRG